MSIWPGSTRLTLWLEAAPDDEGVKDDLGDSEEECGDTTCIRGPWLVELSMGLLRNFAVLVESPI